MKMGPFYFILVITKTPAGYQKIAPQASHPQGQVYFSCKNEYS
jgi:hypothetical protein